MYLGKTADEQPKKRKMVQMAVRLHERLPKDLPPCPAVNVDKDYLFSDANLFVRAKLDAGIYAENDVVHVSLLVSRVGGHCARKIRVVAVQQVGVAMFSSGNFKNVIGVGKIGGGGEEKKEEDKIEGTGSGKVGKKKRRSAEWHPLDPSESSYRVSVPVKLELDSRREDFSWVAMDEPARKDEDVKHMAPTVVHAHKAMFIIRVHYYVHVRLWFGVMRRGLSLKLPFLMKRCRAAEKELAAALLDKSPQQTSIAAAASATKPQEKSPN